MKILGISDAHDSGVALIENGKIIYAANEERFNRKKLFWGFPKKSLNDLIKYSKTDTSSIDYVAIGSLGTLDSLETIGFDDNNIGLPRKIFEKTTKLLGPLTASKPAVSLMKNMIKFSRKNKPLISSYLKKTGINAPITYFDHHTSHAASVYFTSGFKEALVITADGGGDGIAGTVYKAEDGHMERISECPKIHSIGNFWEYITYICGFNDIFKDGGKITGLAAYQPDKALYQKLRKYYGYSKSDLHFHNNTYLFWRESLKFLREVFGDAPITGISFAAQRVLEENMCGIVHEAVKRTGISKVALAGGTFANVRLNQKILELDNVDEIYIFPHMGDGGLAVGAALYMFSKIKKLTPFRLDDVYLGPSYDENRIVDACEKFEVKYERISNVAEKVASLLDKKEVVGVFHGRMEYGPRALGNRTILAEPTDTTMMDWLNNKLGRTEFMPFAPIILEERAPEYFDNIEAGMYPAKFMTMCFDCTDLAIKKAPGIVHKDGTARPQTVDKKTNKYLYDILAEYEKRTGLPLIINTSFNKHEEPIVCNPEDAINGFIRGIVDNLFIENYHISK